MKGRSGSLCFWLGVRLLENVSILLSNWGRLLKVGVMWDIVEGNEGNWGGSGNYGFIWSREMTCFETPSVLALYLWHSWTASHIGIGGTCFWANSTYRIMMNFIIIYYFMYHLQVKMAAPVRCIQDQDAQLLMGKCNKKKNPSAGRAKHATSPQDRQ